MPVVWSINIGNAIGESYEIASNAENIMRQSNKMRIYIGRWCLHFLNLQLRKHCQTYFLPNIKNQRILEDVRSYFVPHFISSQHCYQQILTYGVFSFSSSLTTRVLLEYNS